VDPRVVDLAFPVTATQVRRDHAYPLYGALCHLRPELHEATWLGVHGISGRGVGDTLMVDRDSDLRVRVPVERVGELLGLAGKSLEVAGARVMIGAPRIVLLAPARALRSRIVVIRLTRPPEKDGRIDQSQFETRFREELARQLARIEVTAEVAVGRKRVLGVGGQQIIGYEVRISGLGEADSLRVQEVGIGGKRKMGCGLFRPAREVERA
jgi:CRISPR-associated protein Cas6